MLKGAGNLRHRRIDVKKPKHLAGFAIACQRASTQADDRDFLLGTGSAELRKDLPDWPSLMVVAERLPIDVANQRIHKEIGRRQRGYGGIDGRQGLVVAMVQLNSVRGCAVG